MDNKELLGKYKLVLGLEIHLEPSTSKKMFCRCSTDIFNAKPNTHTCPVCLGLPGALPVPNFDAIRKIQILGLAMNCKLNAESRFDRKHYFYHDLPKSYQISQYKQPFCINGHVDLKNGMHVNIERIHLEEDTAKSIHSGSNTLIDFNMSGMPLIEIVTTPCFRQVEDAVEFSKEVQRIARELDISDVDMEKGEMRLEPNTSLRTEEMEKSDVLPNYKVEIKNINSFKFMEKAVLAEIKRQKEVLEGGGMPIQENRGFIEATASTVSQRKKEQAHDYRYFPEPDIPPIEFNKKYFNDLHVEFDEIRKKSPSFLKLEILERIKSPDITEEILKAEEILEIESLIKIESLINKGNNKKKILNLFLNKKEIRQLSITVIEDMVKESLDKLTDNDFLEKAVLKILDENKDAVDSYLKGKESAIQFLMGMVMRETKGKADAIKTKEILLKHINK